MPSEKKAKEKGKRSTSLSRRASLKNTVTATLSQLPPSEAYIVVDSKKCSGCQTCMHACSLVHEGSVNPDFARLQVLRDPFGTFPTDLTINQCRQCVFPDCVAACPTGACMVDKDNGNIRTIDQTECIGCQKCIQACPYTPSRVIWNNITLKAMKCDLCLDTPYWDEKGGINGSQACVKSCPMRAITLSKEVPSQIATLGYDINLRSSTWPLYKGD